MGGGGEGRGGGEREETWRPNNLATCHDTIQVYSYFMCIGPPDVGYLIDIILLIIYSSG